MCPMCSVPEEYGSISCTLYFGFAGAASVSKTRASSQRFCHFSSIACGWYSTTPRYPFFLLRSLPDSVSSVVKLLRSALLSGVCVSSSLFSSLLLAAPPPSSFVVLQLSSSPPLSASKIASPQQAPAPSIPPTPTTSPRSAGRPRDRR